MDNSTKPSSAFGVDPKTGNLVGAPSSMPMRGDALARELSKGSLNPKHGLTVPQKVKGKA